MTYIYLAGIKNDTERKEFTIVCNKNFQTIIFDNDLPMDNDWNHLKLEIRDCTRGKLVKKLKELKPQLEKMLEIKGSLIETAVIKRHKDYKRI